MRTFVSTLLSGGVATVLLLAGCSGGGSGAGAGVSSGPMFVETCSLGCSSGAGGDQVSCAIVATSVNNEISVYFSEPINAASVSSSTVQLIDVNSGQVPVGTRFVDPSNPRRLVFRPLITFDSAGNPSYGFDANKTYRITVPGQSQGDDPPFVTSLGGKPNRSRLQCDILTSAQPVDLVPGPPVVTASVDLAIPGTPDPNDRLVDQPASGAVDVWRSSKIKLVFNDVMNPVTLVNQTTHQANFITVNVDPDGNPATDDDVPLAGTWDLQLDLDNLQTILTFTSPTGMPSGGASHARKVVVNIPTNVQDLAQNGLAAPVEISFVPETTTVGAVVLPDADGENFDDLSNCNISETSATWTGGRLVRGFGGGSGRLGKLVVRDGDTLTLNTDMTEFPLPNTARDLLDNAIPGQGGFLPGDVATWPKITVTDGIFEFTSITVPATSRLVITGSKPARIFSRGPVSIQGVVDVRGSLPQTFTGGTVAGAWDSQQARGQAGGASGPGGGAGGAGGDRVDNTGNTTILNLTQTVTVPPLPAGTQQGIVNVAADVNGRPSQGVDQIVGGLGAASGGLHFPAAFPLTTATLGPNVGDVRFTVLDPDLLSSCFVQMLANPGGGGGYGTAGTNGVPSVLPDFLLAEDASPNLPPQVAGDANGDGGPGGTGIGLEPPDPESGHVLRKLAVENGALRGGSGGGGGGTHLFNTHSSSMSGVCAVTGVNIDHYYDNSACGGGGGGGALQLVSGKTLSISGTIDARGGDGGSAITTPPTTDPQNPDGRRSHAAPGGGGSGGAVRLQGTLLSITGNPTPGTSRVNVSGGAGGATDNCDGPGLCVSRGGTGGAGLIRLEDTTGLLTRLGEAPKFLPFNLALDAESRDWLSVGLWNLPRRRPESFTGAVSCWMHPTGNYFQITFRPDDPLGATLDDKFGWNMEVLYDDGGPLGERAIPYRFPTGQGPAGWPFAEDPEHKLLNNLNYGLPAAQRSYFAVRFQGAILSTSFTGSLCDVRLDGGSPNIVPGSLTPWVRHPSELNQFSPRPNMIRFTVVFDTALETPGSLASFIKGVRDLKVHAQPD